MEKKIPAKNYLIVLVVSIIIIIIILLGRIYYNNYKEVKLNISVLSTNGVKEININDLDYALDETTEVLLYVGYTGSSKVNSMEKKLYKELERKNLLEKFMYLDVSDYMKSNNYLAILKSKFPLIENEITQAPMIIYVKDGIPVEAMSSELKMIDYTVLNNMIEKYEIE